MKALPILFSAPMVCALLEGRKTQTRRVVKPQPEPWGENGLQWNGHRPNSPYGATSYMGPGDPTKGLSIFMSWSCPYGQPRDLLWVRETWVPRGNYQGRDKSYITTTENEVVDRAAGVEYRDDWLGMDDDIRWKPSIFMPRWASRLTLRIKAIRVERLTDISEADAQAEGVARFKVAYPNPTEYPADWYPETHRHSYELLWDQINGKGSWAANPWVWVVEFEVIKDNVDNVIAQLSKSQ